MLIHFCRDDKHAKHSCGAVQPDCVDFVRDSGKDATGEPLSLIVPSKGESFNVIGTRADIVEQINAALAEEGTPALVHLDSCAIQAVNVVSLKLKGEVKRKHNAAGEVVESQPIATDVVMSGGNECCIAMTMDELFAALNANMFEAEEVEEVEEVAVEA